MKLRQVTLGKLHVTFTGVVLGTIACGALAGLIGFSSTGTAMTYAATPGMQDELQIQLSSDGFSPSEVQHAAGTFAIVVENSNIAGDYTLRRKAPDGTVVKEVPVQTIWINQQEIPANTTSLARARVPYTYAKRALHELFHVAGTTGLYSHDLMDKAARAIDSDAGEDFDTIMKKHCLPPEMRRGFDL